MDATEDDGMRRFAAGPSGPYLRSGVLTFRVPDPRRELAAVRFVSDGTKRRPPAFSRRDGRWELRLPEPRLVRLEYVLELEAEDGSRTLVLDPGNPLRAPGPFGERSVLELDGYGPPAWLEQQAPRGVLEPLVLTSPALRAEIEGLLWHPPGRERDEPLPALVVHDGPEYATYAGLARYLDVATTRGELPPVRAALLPPVERNETYSASARYTRAFVRDLLPAVRKKAPTTALVGMGASLGALAMLHVHRTHPGTFGGLFLQSGSFFQRRFDPYERGFARFARIARFVGRVLGGDAWQHPVPVTITCGTGEENLENNRELAAALARQGYPAELLAHRDAHNWVSWRDVLDPHLARLVARAVG